MRNDKKNFEKCENIFVFEILGHYLYIMKEYHKGLPGIRSTHSINREYSRENRWYVFPYTLKIVLFRRLGNKRIKELKNNN